MKPRLLDLFCGAGGAAVGYHRAGFEVVGVDIEAQRNYPFEFYQGDALTVLQEGLNGDEWGDGQFQAIHASPPCQDYSKAMRHLSAPQPRLIDPVQDLLERTGLPWVIENVEGAPLPRQNTLDGRYGVELCGTMFGLRIYRHRLFETNFPLSSPQGCDHRERAMNPHNRLGRERIWAEFGKQNPDPIWNNAMGVPWMTRYEAREAIPPAYTEWIGVALLAHLVEQEVAA